MFVKEKPAFAGKPMVFRLIFVFLLFLFSSAWLPIPAQQTGQTFPLRQESPKSGASRNRGALSVPFDLSGNNILVRARINRSPPVWCVFDSGASINVLNDRIARKLGLISKGSSVLDANGGTVTGSLVENATINLSNVKTVNQTIATVPLDALAEYSGRDVQGIIGNNFIQNFVVEIDYANRILVFHDHRDYSLANEPAAIELENRNGNPFIKAQISLDGKQIITDFFEIDTGSNGIFSIYSPFAEKHQLRQTIAQSNIAEGVGGAGVGGETQYLDARIESVKLGNYLLKRPIISISQGAEASDSKFDTGIIGTDLLRRFTVILDYQSNRILLKPNAAFNEPFEADLSGLELVTEANNFSLIKIKHVRAKFPAAAAGLREGDTIVTVENRPAARYGLSKLAQMFRQDGKEYRLTIKRDNRVINARLKLKRII